MVKAVELWKHIPKPATARKIVTMCVELPYTMRFTKGKDVLGQEIYTIETRSVLLGLDDFCMDFTETFTSEEEARSFYRTARKEAKKEYERLQKKFEERKRKYHDV